MSHDLLGLRPICKGYAHVFHTLEEISLPLKLRNIVVIVISEFLKRYSKAKRTRAPAYSRALWRIKGGFQREGSREAQVRFPEYQEATE